MKWVSLVLFVLLPFLEGFVLEGIEDLQLDTIEEECGHDQFQCGDGDCIPQRWMCDETPDCVDGSDETKCPESGCKEGQFQCQSTKKCIPVGWLCDGEMDCGSTELHILDNSDESTTECQKGQHCPPNQWRCSDELTCIQISKLCDGSNDCPDHSDEHKHCDNKTVCERAQCKYGCKPAKGVSICYCPPGKQYNEVECIDTDECKLDVYCEQLCTNSEGSYSCDCVNGYAKDGDHCKGINVPEGEPPTLILTSSTDIQHTFLNGSLVAGDKSHSRTEALAMDFNHRNNSVCWVHKPRLDDQPNLLKCAQMDKFQDNYTLPEPKIYKLDAVNQIAYDWISGNWYFLCDHKRRILLCNSNLTYCVSLIDSGLGSPKGIALDPTKGFMFMTEWDGVPPILERALLDGSNRTRLVKNKIVYPYGVAVDIPSQHVYWVDTYLDFVERIDYDGGNRRTVIKGAPVQNLYEVSVWESYLYVTSWRKHAVLRIHKQNPLDVSTVMGNLSRPFVVHVYHRQRQPEVDHPCTTNNGGCQQLCIPKWKKTVGVAQCMCIAGYKLQNDGSCTVAKRNQFLMFVKRREEVANGGEIKGISMQPGERQQEVITPIIELTYPRAFAYYAKNETIYYSDIQR